MLIKAPGDDTAPPVLFSDSWDLLGPFQIGTREASWGADPLEELGGFRTLRVDGDAVFASSLGLGGTVRWSRCEVDLIHCGADATEATLGIAFPSANWSFHQSVYGWAGLQYQAWARGTLTITGQGWRTIVLYTDNILEYRIDGQHYFGGDYYGYRRAPPVLRLEPGVFVIEVRLIRDVRVLGSESAAMKVHLRAESVGGGLKVIQDKMLFADVIDDRLASPWAAVPLRNDTQEWVEIRSVRSLEPVSQDLHQIAFPPMRLAPGQSRPLTLHIEHRRVTSLAITISILFSVDNDLGRCVQVSASHDLKKASKYAPHKVTFLHPSQTVSYAILRPPTTSSTDLHQPLPVFLGLHGAGLESDSDQVRHMFDAVPDLRAWVILPTGGTSWSGDDWHDWGLADAKAAIRSIVCWIENTRWKGPPVDVNKWFVSGHSNGGQGALHALTHEPDQILGAAPVSAYTSIQAYVPYQMWIEADPRITLMRDSALMSFRHEILLSNVKGIPFLEQHGSSDNNVPAFHSRRLHQLTQEQNPSGSYVELEGKGHWFDGVMTTHSLKRFYDHCLTGEANLPGLPEVFTIVMANPRDMGSKGGVMVEQLQSPCQLGRIEVMAKQCSSEVILRTSNVRRFHLQLTGAIRRLATKLVIDGHSVALPNKWPHSYSREEGIWKLSYDVRWVLKERSGSQLGPLTAILDSSGCFQINYQPQDAFETALQVSRNLYQYYGADTDLNPGHHVSGPGNTITVALGLPPKTPSVPSFPIAIGGEGVSIRRSDGSVSLYASQKGLGVICLRPLPSGTLELVIWGSALEGLQQAARLLPLLTGVGQPDFIVIAHAMAWRGAAGVLAMGFFDSLWQVSEVSYLQ